MITSRIEWRGRQRGLAARGAGARGTRRQGFTLVELLLAVLVMTIMSVIALPFVGSEVRSYRMQGAVNMLASELTLAKMKSVAQDTPYEVAASGATISLEVENLTTDTFSLVTNTSALTLPTGVSFGYGTLTSGAGDGTEQESSTGSLAPAQSTAIIFNSMGLPVNSSGTPLAQNAWYVTDGRNIGAVTVSLSGRILSWSWNGSAWVEE